MEGKYPYGHTKVPVFKEALCESAQECKLLRPGQSIEKSRAKAADCSFEMFGITLRTFREVSILVNKVWQGDLTEIRNISYQRL